MNLKKQMFAEALAKGLTYREIAEAMHVTLRALFYWRAQLYLPRHLSKNGKQIGRRGRGE